MLTEALLVVTFVMSAPVALVEVHTDSVPAHWREWPVKSEGRLARSERCQARIDASRVLRGKQVTQGLPWRCMTRWERRNLRPDPAP